MFKMILAIVLAVALSGCQTLADMDAAIQKSAPQVCAGASATYTAFVATGLGSDRDKAVVAAAWAAVAPICDEPTKATATQLAVVAVQIGIIVKTMRKVKTDG
jgi:uncharacterized protein YceK